MFEFLFSKKNSEPADEAFSAAWLRPIIEELSDAALAYDEDFKILIFNKRAERLFSLSAKSVLGRIVSLDKASDPQFKFLVQVLFPSLAPSVILKTDAGVYPQLADLNFEETHLRVTTNRIVDASGKVRGFTKVIRDRTREVEILKSKSEFLTIAAHQLRTPLTAVNWAFEGLINDAELNVDSKELAETGGAAAKKLLKIVDDLLDAAKLEDGKFGYTFAEHNLVEFIDKLLVEVEPIAKEYKVNLFFSAKQAIVLTFDEVKLGIALTNLIDNAIKYNVLNGTVTVGIQLASDPRFVQVSVVDTGVGIPEGDIKKLFTKFFRAENVMQFSTEGSGLGLYVVKNIIMRHGGNIWVESQLNRGTTVHFTLPIDPSLIPQKELIIEEEF